MCLLIGARKKLTNYSIDNNIQKIIKYSMLLKGIIKIDFFILNF